MLIYQMRHNVSHFGEEVSLILICWAVQGNSDGRQSAKMLGPKTHGTNFKDPFNKYSKDFKLLC